MSFARGAIFVFASLALMACATVTTEQTQPLVTATTEARADLRAETQAIDTAYATLGNRAEVVCRDTPPDVAAAFCGRWRPASGAPAGAEQNAKTLSQIADSGMSELAGYVGALNSLAEAGEASAGAAEQASTRLQAFVGLFDVASGPIKVLAGPAFQSAFRYIAQAQTAHEVNGTMLEATAAAQMPLDVYVMAMREALGACDAPISAQMRQRLLSYARLSEDAPDLSGAACRAGEGGAMPSKPYHEAIDLIAEEMNRSAEFANDIDQAGAVIYENYAAELSIARAAKVRAVMEARAAVAAHDTAATRQLLHDAMAELRDLEDLREILAPYEDDVRTLDAQREATAQWRRERHAGASRVARRLLALADAHAAFRAGVAENRRLLAPNPLEVLAPAAKE